jgi:hypothetical protein
MVLKILNLTDRNWRAFPLTSIFVIKPGKRLTKSDMIRGKRPFIGATEFGNGITNWVSNSNASIDSDVLGVNYNGSVVETFYHPYECIFSDDVKRFRLKDRRGNRLVYLFLKTAIVQQKLKYAYGYKFNEERMNKQSILLPIDEHGKPDWAFMEQFIYEREVNLLEEYKQFILNKYLLSAERGEVPLPSDSDVWREYIVTDLFDIATGTENNMAALRGGLIPLISAKKIDNGLKAFVSTEKIRSGRVITWNKDGDGGAGLAYYQPSDFAADSHILILSPKKQISQAACIFLTTALSQYYGIFGHGRANSLQRISKTQILLPSTHDGNPDWTFMENYIQSQEERLIADYSKYINDYFSYRASKNSAFVN